MPQNPRATLRTAGRVVLLDATDAVLLVHEREGAEVSRWLTPGGGVEAGETPGQAAVRELWEETGLVVTIPPDRAAWHVDRAVWTIDDDRYDQTNHYFLVRIAAHAPPATPSALTEYEQTIVLGARWWPMDELRATTEQVWPAGLAGLLATEIAGRPAGTG